MEKKYKMMQKIGMLCIFIGIACIGMGWSYSTGSKVYMQTLFMLAGGLLLGLGFYLPYNSLRCPHCKGKLSNKDGMPKVCPYCEETIE